MGMFNYEGTLYAFPQLTSGAGDTGSQSHRRSRPVKTKRKPRRAVNYAGRNRPATEALHARMFDALAHSPAITVRELGEQLGISRQLCLYHVKKMVAQDRVIAELAPCHQNGGVQFVLYTKLQRAVELGAWLLRQQGRIAA